MFPEFEAEISALEAKFHEKSGGNIVFYGSSSMRLWPRLAHDFPNVFIENFGFGGSTLEQCAFFFERLIVPRKPRGIVFYGGDNDLFLGASPENVWDSLRVLLDARDEILGAIPFAFLSIKPSPSREELLPAIIESNEWCQREIASRENAQWIEVFAAMRDENRAPRPSLYAPDGLHLSRAGYALWREILARDVTWLSN
ncbi:Lysophospholipase L1 [Abditibacterium utsteinense]|uniref:Lysophospholipase L1 n=1 Tax=Abditibacterium utsteinense TaxID=1960156 RepID=A0A2S8SWG7_9BACT|nr:GDSL-type esterase/lipase family protein [Abditibacterium utsteinense]PQV65140.1 Lysophospholipase L1 [Abditibacterium utsteinense]